MRQKRSKVTSASFGVEWLDTSAVSCIARLLLATLCHGECIIVRCNLMTIGGAVHVHRGVRTGTVILSLTCVHTTDFWHMIRQAATRVRAVLVGHQDRVRHS